jgi:hypothetical protein
LTDPRADAQPLYADPLLESLRTALLEHFEDAGRPDAVDFRITEEHDDIEGLAWAGDGALLLHGSLTVAADDLTEAVGDELDTLSLDRAPRFGDTLVIVLSPGFVPAPQDAADDESQSPALDPQDPQPALAEYTDATLDRIERALHTVRLGRTQEALTRAALAALVELADEEPLVSTAPVGRIVFRTRWNEEDGTHFTTLASAHHADGTATPDLDFEGFADEQLGDLSDLMWPNDGETLIVTLPGVTMLVEPCTVCDDKDCADKGGHPFMTCARCPEPFTVEHHAHPRTGCPGFAPLPARTPAPA